MEEIDIDDEDCMEGMSTWENSLIGFAPGLTPTLQGIQRFTQAKWMGAGSKSVHQLKQGVFIFQFESEDSMKEVLNLGPWSYFDRPLVLQIWKPDLDFDPTNMKALPVWVNLPDLRLHLWSSKIISKIASTLGKPLGCDGSTARRENLEHARVCIEIDAGHKLPESIKLKTPHDVVTQKIQYECLPLRCLQCHHFGHEEATCRAKLIQQVKGNTKKDTNPNPPKHPMDKHVQLAPPPALTPDDLAQEKEKIEKGKAKQTEEGTVLISQIEVLLPNKGNSTLSKGATSSSIFSEDSRSDKASSSSFFADMADSEELQSMEQMNKKLTKKQKKKMRKGTNPLPIN